MLICHPYNFFGKSSVYILVHSKYWVACFLMVNFKTLFGNNYRFKGSCKEMYSLQSLSPSVNILPNYGTILISENWHWYNPQRLFRFYQLYIYLCVCFYAVLSHVWFCVGSTTINVQNCVITTMFLSCYLSTASPTSYCISFTLVNHYLVYHLYNVVPRMLYTWKPTI